MSHINATMPILDPLKLHLAGQQLIEASAGTGKTWNLSAIYLRLVLGHQQRICADRVLLPPDILVMTFTDAATEELKERIRSRLVEAKTAFQQGQAADPFLKRLLNEYQPDEYQGCVQRLSLALEWMDEAQILTIHGWSKKMLQHYAFDSHNAFEQKLLENKPQALLTAVIHYWRNYYYPITDVACLQLIQAWAVTPNQLLNKKLKGRLTLNLQQQVDPQNLIAPEEALAAKIQWLAEKQSRRQHLQQLWRSGGQDCFLERQAKGALHGNYYKENRVQLIFAWLDDLTTSDPEEKALIAFSRHGFKVKKNHTPPEHPFFDAMDAYVALNQAEPEAADEQLAAHAAYHITHIYQRNKQLNNEFDFDDLLFLLERSLARNPQLAEQIRQQLPVALVDEFQDTDQLQYASLQTIYAGQADTLLLMVGDPKQAIYAFRGADIDTYLVAKQAASEIHTLNKNYRSRTEMISSVNNLFLHADQAYPKGAFIYEDKDIHYVEIEAGKSLTAAQRHGKDIPAITFWTAYEPEKELSQEKAIPQMAKHCANEIAQLLNDQCTLSSDDGERPCQASDVVVLVNDKQEAAQIEHALKQCGLPSVYLSDKNSIFNSREASDVYHWLTAIHRPESIRLLRVALATQTMAKSLALLDALSTDEQLIDEWIERCYQWRYMWQRQGVMPLIQHLIQQENLAHYWQQQLSGARVLTNLLHLSELLQQASQQHEGEQALIDWLGARIHEANNADQEEKTYQLRLESDHSSIRILTIHKSKGLEFPFVFIPYANLIKAKVPKGTQLDEQQIRQGQQEAVRKLYVALTRASHAMWLGVAQKEFNQSALGYLLTGGDSSTTLDDALTAWQQQEASEIQLEAISEGDTQRQIQYQPQAITPVLTSPLSAQQRHWPMWRKVSYSSITKNKQVQQAVVLDSPQTTNEQHLQESWLTQDSDANIATVLPWQQIIAGAELGTAVHDCFEWMLAYEGNINLDCLTDYWQTQISQQSKLATQDADLLAAWLYQLWQQPVLPIDESATINTSSLSQLTQGHYWPEMAFYLPLNQVNSSDLDALFQQMILPGQARPALQAQQLGGLVNGFIDLVFEHQGRYYILDYKTNRLDDYGQMSCQQAILTERFDVQASLYLLTLHRLLSQRLPHYCYAEHMGGALYWFVRGSDKEQPQQGIWHYLPTESELLQLSDCMQQQGDE